MLILILSFGAELQIFLLQILGTHFFNISYVKATFTVEANLLEKKSIIGEVQGLLGNRLQKEVIIPIFQQGQTFSVTSLSIFVIYDFVLSTCNVIGLSPSYLNVYLLS